MHRHGKPVRKCHACGLNLGDHCWIYAYPRGQWRQGRSCPGIGDSRLLDAYRAWRKMPTVKTRRELCRELFRSRRPARARGPKPDGADGKRAPQERQAT